MSLKAASATSLHPCEVTVFKNEVCIVKHEGTSPLGSVQLPVSSSALSRVLRTLAASPAGAVVSVDTQPCGDFPVVDVSDYVSLLRSLSGHSVSLISQKNERVVSGTVVCVSESWEKFGGDPVKEYDVQVLSRNGIESFLVRDIVRLVVEDEVLSHAMLRQLLGNNRSSAIVSILWEDVPREGRVTLQYAHPSSEWLAQYRLDLFGPAVLSMNAKVRNPTLSEWKKVKLRLASGSIMLLDEEHSVTNSKTSVSSDTMLVSVKTLSGKSLTIPVGVQGTVGDLKELVAEQEGIPSAQQRMIFSGKQLEDGRRLNYYGVLGGSVVHLVLALRGDSSSVAGIGDSDAVIPKQDHRVHPETVQESMKLKVFEVGSLVDAAPGATVVVEAASLDLPDCEVCLVYDHSVRPAQALLAARVTNNSGYSWEGGPMCIYGSGGFQGETLLHRLRPGEVQLACYGVASTVAISRISWTWCPSEGVRGYPRFTGVALEQWKDLSRSIILTRHKEYKATAWIISVGDDDETGKALLVNHSIDGGWELVDDSEETDVDILDADVQEQRRSRARKLFDATDSQRLRLSKVDGGNTGLGGCHRVRVLRLRYELEKHPIGGTSPVRYVCVVVECKESERQHRLYNADPEWCRHVCGLSIMAPEERIQIHDALLRRNAMHAVASMRDSPGSASRAKVGEWSDLMINKTLIDQAWAVVKICEEVRLKEEEVRDSEKAVERAIADQPRIRGNIAALEKLAAKDATELLQRMVRTFGESEELISREKETLKGRREVLEELSEKRRSLEILLTEHAQKEWERLKNPEDFPSLAVHAVRT